jgi:D-alanyl-D-alanine dipeptidase
MKQDVYKDLEKAYLQEEVAGMLKQAQAYLEKEHPGYSLIIYDAARPFTVQKRMWAIVKGTNHARYVAPPDAKGSMHNYGCAVDLSVVDDKGSPLDMGTPFDFFGEAAHSTHEAELVKAGKLTQRQWDNRLILRKAMHQAGFTVLKREWWHFNAFPDATVLKRYKKIP